MIITKVLTDTVMSVDVCDAENILIQNIGDSTVYASMINTVVPGNNGVLTIPAGAQVTIQGVCKFKRAGGKYNWRGKLYFKGPGTVQCISTDTVNFRGPQKGGGGSSDAAAIARIDNALINYNCIKFTNLKDAKGGGEVTFTWADDVTCNVSGTTTAQRFCNYTYSPNSLPKGMVAGDKIYVHFTSTDKNIRLRALFYTNGTLGGSVYFDESGVLNIPATATGIVIRINVAPNVTVDGSCTVDILSARTNKELEAAIGSSSSIYPKTGKYVAFGDSLTWGAVWGPTPGVHYTQASDKYRIPTRIAVATGFESNFDNQGSSGAGYVKVGSAGDTITGNVLAYDYTDVSLITVMGGANDKSTIGLGTASATANDGTICGALKAIIDFVKTNVTKATLVIIQPTPSGSNSIDDIWNGVEGGGWSLNDFDREVSKLCQAEHVVYVNWWESNYCNNWKLHSGGYNMSTGPNYSHPKEEADYAIIGDFIGGKIAASTVEKKHVLESMLNEKYIQPLSAQSAYNCSNLLPTVLPNKTYPELSFDFNDGVYHVYGTPTTATRFVEIDGGTATIPSWFISGRKVYIKFTSNTPLFLGLRYFSTAKPNGDWFMQVKQNTVFTVPDTSQYTGFAFRLQIPKQAAGYSIDEYVSIAILDSMSNTELSERVEAITPPTKTYPPLFTLIDDDGDKHFLSDIVPIIEEKQAPIASAVSWHFLSQGEGYTADTDTPSPTGKKPRWMDWEQVEEAYGRGAEILNHTYRHLAGSVASQKTVTDLSYTYGRMKNRIDMHGMSGSDIIVFSSSSGNYENAQKAATYVGKAAIKIGGNVANTPDSNIYALSRYRIDYASTEGGTDWDYEAMKTWVDNCAVNGGWMIGMFHTSNEIYRHAVAVDESGNAKYDSDGNLLVLYYASGSSGATTELPIGQSTNLTRVFGDDGGVTLTVGKVLYVPMLKNIIDYAREKGVTVCTAAYALKTYYGV